MEPSKKLVIKTGKKSNNSKIKRIKSKPLKSLEFRGFFKC